MGAELHLDATVRGDEVALHEALQSAAEADRADRLGLMQVPGQGLLHHARKWLQLARDNYSEHDYETAATQLETALAIGQHGLHSSSVGSGYIQRQTCELAAEAASAHPGSDSDRVPNLVNVVLDAFWWRALCRRGIGATDRATADLERLLKWYNPACTPDSIAIRCRAAHVHCEHAEVLFEGSRTKLALDAARSAVSLMPADQRAQELLEDISVCRSQCSLQRFAGCNPCVAAPRGI